MRAVLRPEDLLSIRLETTNFNLLKGSARLELVKDSEPGYLVIVFQGQNVGEEAVEEVDNNGKPVPPPLPTGAFLASESGLV